MSLSDKRLIAVEGSAILGSNHQPNYMLGSNDRQFSKRVYTKQDQHTGESKSYMQSSIDLSFDGGNYFGIDKGFKKQDLRTIMDKSAR